VGKKKDRDNSPQREKRATECHLRLTKKQKKERRMEWEEKRWKKGEGRPEESDSSKKEYALTLSKSRV